jgi:transcriptional regulator with XRE-family HTH domain
MTRKILQDDPRRATVGERLKTARLATGRTQDEVAALLGTSRTVVSGAESGRRIASWIDWVDQVVTLGYDLRIVAPELLVAQAELEAKDGTRGVESNFPRTRRPGHDAKK